MKNLNGVKKLGRTKSHRDALLSNLATELILHREKGIKTTEAKAKAMKVYVDKLITKAKKGTLHAQREVFKVIKNKEAIQALFQDVVAKTENRHGGYTRIIKLAPRLGDAAKLAYIQFVDFAEEAVKPKAKAKQDRAKRVKGSKKNVETTEAVEVKATEVTDVETAEVKMTKKEKVTKKPKE